MKKVVFIIAMLTASLTFFSCSDESKLEMVIEEANKDLPMKVEEGVVVTSILKEGNDVVYVCTLDEEILMGETLDDSDVDNLKKILQEYKAQNPKEWKSIEKEMKEGIISELEDDYDAKELTKLIKSVKGSLKYRVKGKHTKMKLFDVTIETEDL